MKNYESKLQSVRFENQRDNAIFTVDTNRRYEQGKTKGFYVTGTTCCIYTDKILKYALKHGEFNKGLCHFKIVN